VKIGHDDEIRVGDSFLRLTVHERTLPLSRG
jgi:hypothetical protein